MNSEKNHNENPSEKKPVFFDLNMKNYSQLTPEEQMEIARRIHSGFVQSTNQKSTKVTSEDSQPDKS
jgi:hypothetical protein